MKKQDGLGGDFSGSGGADVIQDGSGGDGAGGDGTGGDGTGGSIDVPIPPDYPCSTDCIEPHLLVRTIEVDVPGIVTTSLGGEVLRSTDPVHGGEYSLAFSQGSAGSLAQTAEAISSQAEGTLCFRAWLYVPE